MLRGDYRYESDELAEILTNTDYDLVPIVVGKNNDGSYLKDGHHRWRAYDIANIKPLIWQVEVIKTTTPGDPNLILEIEPGVETKSAINETANAMENKKLSFMIEQFYKAAQSLFESSKGEFSKLSDLIDDYCVLPPSIRLVSRDGEMVYVADFMHVTEGKHKLYGSSPHEVFMKLKEFLENHK